MHIDSGRLPLWTIAAPILAAGLSLAKLFHMVEGGPVILLLALALLLASVFAAVTHAEVLALKLGEPFGSILLAIAVTVIELGLILSVMLSDPIAGQTVARDTVVATVMLVLNLIIGLCLVLGGGRHFSQPFSTEGTSAALVVLGTLAGITLVLPNYTITVASASYSSVQLAVVATVSLVLYGVFVFVQTIRHRDYFLDKTHTETHAEPATAMALQSLVLLLVGLFGVVILAKTLSVPLGQGVAAAGLPHTFVGVVVAAIVLLPESIAAVRSALANKLQNSLNLALGSGIATIGLTVPAVALFSLITGQPILLGVSFAQVALLAMTLFASVLTLGTGRTTILQGAVHLTLAAVFLLVAAMP